MMLAPRFYAMAMQKMSDSLRQIEPKLLFRDIQVITRFYVPSRVLGMFYPFYPVPLKNMYNDHIHSPNPQLVLDVHCACYRWIEMHAMEYSAYIYQHWLDYRDQEYGQ